MSPTDQTFSSLRFNAARMAAQARTLWELLADAASENVRTNTAADDAGAAAGLVDSWRRMAANGRPDAFARRLSWDGIDIATVERASRLHEWPRARPLPAWLGIVQESLDEGTTHSNLDSVRDESLSHEEPVPFEAVLLPWVIVARRRLRTRIGSAIQLCAPAAHSALERHLLGALAQAAGPTLLAQLSLEREQGRWELDRELGLSTSDDERFSLFVRQMLSGGFGALLDSHPVLARTLATTTEYWVDATAEFLSRLSSDALELSQRFAAGETLGTVTSVLPGQSDPHYGRRTVSIVTFSSGVQLVYKPKDLGLDEAFGHLISWLNTKNRTLDLRGCVMVNRGSHGWAEYVSERSSETIEGISRFYQRAGMLLCLAYVLEATDLTQDNVIAHGEYPVLIDLETLLHPRIRRDPDSAASGAPALADERWDHSVLRTAFVPTWEIRLASGIALDRTGLGGAADGDTLPGATWSHVNTNWMTLESAVVAPPRGRHVPTLRGEPIRAHAHVHDVVQGFADMYRVIVEHREQLVADGGPIAAFATQRVRFIHRPTDIYYALLRRLRDPAHLRNGVDQSLQLELLCRAFARASARPLEWDLVAAERRALERADIPHLTASASGIDVSAPPDVNIPIFEAPSFSCVRERIDRLSDEDLAQQIAFIEGAFYTYAARDPQTASGNSASQDIEAAPIDAPALLVCACRIAEAIKRLAIRSPDGGAAWIAPQFHPPTERYLLRPLGPDLYSGVCGVALFLAAADRIAGAGTRDLALGAVRPVLDQSRKPDAFRYLRLGAGVGLGSIVYGLVVIGWLLDEPTLLEDAARVAARITDSRITAEESPDALAGSAGAILAFDVLHAATGSCEWIDRANACGQHVLARLESGPSTARAWRTYNGRCLTGLSHGAAGISFALLRLAALTGDMSYVEAAREGIAYEVEVFSPSERNWPDFRAEEPAYPVQWCHGAAGIALSRIGGLPALDTPAIRREIDLALATTEAAAVDDIDHVCCGTMGRVETLMVAADRYGRSDLRPRALQQTAQVLARANRRGGFALHPLLPATVPNPTFFQGTAGIGYTLLRLAAPGQLPSILLWERPAVRFDRPAPAPEKNR